MSKKSKNNTPSNDPNKQAEIEEFSRQVAELQAHLDEPDIQRRLIEQNNDLIVKMVKNAEATNSVNEEDAGIDSNPDSDQRQPIDILIDREESERVRGYWRTIMATLQ